MYKSFKKFYDEATESTTTSSVVGTGDDANTVIVRKKYDRKNKRKDAAEVLRRFSQK